MRFPGSRAGRSRRMIVVAIVALFCSLVAFHSVGTGMTAVADNVSCRSWRFVTRSRRLWVVAGVVISTRRSGRSLGNSRTTTPARGRTTSTVRSMRSSARRTRSVSADQDSFICGAQFGESNHWMEALNDAGSYATNSARILQPFDFAGRTGNLVLRCGQQVTGWRPHALDGSVAYGPARPDFPILRIRARSCFPRNGVGFDFSSSEKDCGTGRNGLRGIHVFNNYTRRLDINSPGTCFTAADDMANHSRSRCRRSHIELWGSDAGGTNFRLLAWLQRALNFTRGYWSFQHVGYNGGKEGNPSNVTYHWHAIGFDGPAPADRP